MAKLHILGYWFFYALHFLNQKKRFTGNAAAYLNRSKEENNSIEKAVEALLYPLFSANDLAIFYLDSSILCSKNLNEIIEIFEDVVTIEIETSVKVKVGILTDDEEYLHYDSDNKSYHYLETNYESFEKEFDPSMIASIKIFGEDDYSEEFEIESINDNKEISFFINNGYR